MGFNLLKKLKNSIDLVVGAGFILFTNKCLPEWETFTKCLKNEKRGDYHEQINDRACESGFLQLLNHRHRFCHGNKQNG